MRGPRFCVGAWVLIGEEVGTPAVAAAVEEPGSALDNRRLTRATSAAGQWSRQNSVTAVRLIWMPWDRNSAAMAPCVWRFASRRTTLSRKGANRLREGALIGERTAMSCSCSGRSAFMTPQYTGKYVTTKAENTRRPSFDIQSTSIRHPNDDYPSTIRRPRMSQNLTAVRGGVSLLL